MNTVKAVLLLGLLSGLMLFCGLMLFLGEPFGGRNGLYMGLLIAVGINFFSYFFSDKLALATYSARPVTPDENQSVYGRVAPLVSGLSQWMSIPMPKLWLINDPSPMRSLLAVTRGMPPSRSHPAFCGRFRMTRLKEL